MTGLTHRIASRAGNDREQNLKVHQESRFNGAGLTKHDH
jgi:hypothetical protein